MKRLVLSLTGLGLTVICAHAQTIIGGSVNNGNLDRTHATEVAPGFFLPKPTGWTYSGSRANTGTFQDGLSSESWAGPAPTPATTDGNLNGPSPEGCGGPDCGVFFKPFTGNATDGAATARLFQDNPATPGLTYTLSGWAGAEANFLGNGAFGLEFLNAANNVIGSQTLDLNANGLFTANGQPFNYKQFNLGGLAPAGAVTVRASVSMLNAMSNPAGGGQAFVVDDFSLVAVPEPSTVALMIVGALGLFALARRRR